MPTKTFTVEGLACVDCADVTPVDHATDTPTVSLATADLAPEQIARATLATNRRREGNPLLGFVRFVLSGRETTMTAMAGLLTLLGLALTVAGTPLWSRIALFSTAIVVGGIPVAHHAWQEVWLARSLGINALMVIAVVGATFIGEWAEAAIVVVLFSLGEALEGYAAEQARSALENLLDLAPPGGGRGATGHRRSGAGASG